MTFNVSVALLLVRYSTANLSVDPAPKTLMGIVRGYRVLSSGRNAGLTGVGRF